MLFKNAIHIFIGFIKVIWIGAFTKAQETDWQIAAQNFKGKSFRTQETERESVLVFFRIAYRFLRSYKFKAPDIKVKENNSEPKQAILDARERSAESRWEFVYFFEKSYPKYFLPRESAFSFQNPILFFLIIPIWVLLGVYIFPFVLFNKSLRASHSLALIEFWEHLFVIEQTQKLGISKLYIFCIYEKDTNLLYLLMRNRGIEIAKVTSEVPLSIWNKNILTDELVICHPYQMDEVKVFSKTIRFNTQKLWGPEQIYKIAHLYKHNQLDAGAENTLAFYSTASWVRAASGHIEQGVSNPKYEKQILEWIAEFLQENEKVHLLVFLHPKERASNFIHKTQEHYTALLGNTNWSFGPLEKSSATCFASAKVGIAQMSTIMFERSYLGFEVLFVPLGVEGFPIKNSMFNGNISMNKEELERNLTLSFNEGY